MAGSAKSVGRASASHCTVGGGGASSHGLGLLQSSTLDSVDVVPMENTRETLVWV
jgi:hypothetical protein